jgi:hypothetical protein
VTDERRPGRHTVMPAGGTRLIGMLLAVPLLAVPLLAVPLLAGPLLAVAAAASGHRQGGPGLPQGVPGVPQPGEESRLDGVYCISPANCWAVGGYAPTGANFQVNEALHWNGSTWSVVTTPQPGGTAAGDVNVLSDVVCATATNCWAGGYHAMDGDALVFLNEVLHWNGAAWSVVATPEPGGTSDHDFNFVSAIRCPAAASCLAVGSYGTGGTTFTEFNEALRWNGTGWSQAATPNPGGTGDGGFSTLDGLGCSSASNCWAGGDYTSAQATLNQVLHWNGTAWSQITVPNPAGTAGAASNTITFITCTSATNCWAVGYELPSSGTLLNEALRWNGSAWSAR